MIDIVNKKFGRLLVVRLDHSIRRRDKKGCEHFYLCKCDCGNEKIVRRSNLISGLTTSCGCYSKEQASKRICQINTKHGFSRKDGSKEKLYGVWDAIKQRCYNPNNKMYKYYGGRGIKMSSLWKKDYTIFREWALKNGYQNGLEIDRKNNNGDYTEQNCRWVSHKENLMNRRNTIHISYQGQKYTVHELGNLLNINPHTIYTRYRRGKYDEETTKNSNEVINSPQEE